MNLDEARAPGAAGSATAAITADLLSRLGMTSVDQLVYAQLCRLGKATPETIATETGLVTAIALRSLGALQAHGLAVPSNAGPLRWAAVTPEAALENLLLDQEEQLRDTRTRIDNLMSAYRRANPATAAEVIEPLEGREVVKERWHRLQTSARSTVLVLDKPPHVERHDESTETRLLRSGVRVRAIYDRSCLLEPGRLEEIQRMVRAGENARVLPRLPFKLAVVDEQRAIMPVTPTTELDRALVIRPSTLLDALIAGFEMQWSVAVPLAAPAGQANEEGKLLMLLAAGMTDEAIARQLGVSTRTVQRRVSELMARLGARNRFQAGIQVARRGLL